ncbi:hypothetical protein IFM89_021305 [Coptis chinensis]|uniref:Uncharacterized protein n=1 Tax=Coptis chinensis TaxID=261450 RepID=A0A835LWN7_9MAGN|nr:hypothetical protein IFM89_021305 [Coptis chinensis]
MNPWSVKSRERNRVAPSSPHVTSHLIDYSDTGRKLHGLKTDLEATEFEIRELKFVAKNAVNKAEQAEKAKTVVEAQLRKWREQKQKRREAAAKELAPKGSNLPKTNKLKLMNIVIVNIVKVTSDHHEEVIKVGINPSLKESESFQKFLYVIAGYPGDVSDRKELKLWVTGQGGYNHEE